MAQEQKNVQEQDLNQLRKVRREKLAELQGSGKDPFVITKYDQTHHSVEVKENYMRCMNGNLSCFCLEYLSFDSDHITDIKFLKFFIIFLTDAVSCYIRLNISF